MEDLDQKLIAFQGTQLVAKGNIIELAQRLKERLSAHDESSVLILDATTSERRELDLRGSIDEVLARLKPQPAPTSNKESVGPGRPKLGVVTREIGLLPRHWEWLARQPGGASAALRRLVEEAKRNSFDRDRVRASQDATYKFLSIVAGNLPHYEDVLRALYAKNVSLFETLIAKWPSDVRDHAQALARPSFAAGESNTSQSH
jgi:hypothetical protein